MILDFRRNVLQLNLYGSRCLAARVAVPRAPVPPLAGVGFVTPSPEQSEGLGNQGSISRSRLPISKTNVWKAEHTRGL